MIRVITADDHAVVRGGVKQLLSAAQDIRVDGEASSGAELLPLMQQVPCDVLLLDITMPDKDGLALLREIRGKWPGVAILILSMHPERQYATRAIRAGARGYLTKTSAPEQLIKAVRAVAGGAHYVSPALEQVLAAQVAGEQGLLSYEALSDREYRVLVRIGEGASVSQIAEEMFLSVNTVKTYRSRVLTKLNLAGTAELIHYVIENKLGS